MTSSSSSSSTSSVGSGSGSNGGGSSIASSSSATVSVSAVSNEAAAVDDVSTALTQAMRLTESTATDKLVNNTRTGSAKQTNSYDTDVTVTADEWLTAAVNPRVYEDDNMETLLTKTFQDVESSYLM